MKICFTYISDKRLFAVGVIPFVGETFEAVDDFISVGRDEVGSGVFYAEHGLVGFQADFRCIGDGLFQDAGVVSGTIGGNHFIHAIRRNINPQKVAVKTNLLYDATTTMNLGLEIGLGKKWSLDLSGNYNPWKFDDETRLRHWGVQPELRYWLCEKFNGHFLGLHGHYAKYNVGGMSFLSDNMERHRYQGHLWGGGISYGYQWLIGKRWNLEATVGLGYARLWDRKYEERNSPAFSMTAPCFGSFHVSAPGSSNMLVSLTTISSTRQLGTIVIPPIVVIGSLEQLTVLTDTRCPSFLKKRPEFSSEITYPGSQSANVSRT